MNEGASNANGFTEHHHRHEMMRCPADSVFVIDSLLQDSICNRQSAIRDLGNGR